MHEASPSHDCCAHHHDHHELRVDGLKVSYRNVLALENVSLATSCGSCIALVGPNGAGKSTLLKTIAGLLPAQQGEVHWRGTKVGRWSREIAYLPQREDVDWKFPITVRKVIAMGRYPQAGWWKPFSQADEDAIDRAIQEMDLHDLEDRQINELSGGQQQRVFLARAIAQEAHALLLDEPFSGLDRTSRIRLAETLRRLASEGRLVMASHHALETVEEIFDEVLLLKQTPIAFGSVKEVFTPDNIKATFDTESSNGKEAS